MTSNITAPTTWICRMRAQNYDWDVAFYRQSTVYISIPSCNQINEKKHEFLRYVRYVR